MPQLSCPVSAVGSKRRAFSRSPAYNQAALTIQANRFVNNNMLAAQAAALEAEHAVSVVTQPQMFSQAANAFREAQ